jgi:hypothetical protein
MARDDGGEKNSGRCRGASAQPRAPERVASPMDDNPPPDRGLVESAARSSIRFRAAFFRMRRRLSMKSPELKVVFLTIA